MELILAETPKNDSYSNLRWDTFICDSFYDNLLYKRNFLSFCIYGEVIYTEEDECRSRDKD